MSRQSRLPGPDTGRVLGYHLAHRVNVLWVVQVVLDGDDRRHVSISIRKIGVEDSARREQVGGGGGGGGLLKAGQGRLTS